MRVCVCVSPQQGVQALTVVSSPLLIDGVGSEDEQTKEDESDGRNRDQQLQG